MDCPLCQAPPNFSEHAFPTCAIAMRACFRLPRLVSIEDHPQSGERPRGVAAGTVAPELTVRLIGGQYGAA